MILGNSIPCHCTDKYSKQCNSTRYKKRIKVVQWKTDLGKRLNIFYASQVAINPPTFVFFVNYPELMHFSYERFLENRIRDSFNFEGTPIKLIARQRN